VTVVCAVLLCTLTAAFTAIAAPRTLYDLSRDFSLTMNPAGPWEFGFSATPSLAPDQFKRYRVADARNPIGFWHPAPEVNADEGYYPYAAWNAAKRSRVDPTRSWALGPGEVALEASNDGQYSIVRFVVPRSGRHRVQARFRGIHARLSSTDVHVLVNATSVLDASVEGYGGDRKFHPRQGRQPRAIFSRALDLQAGDVVSFAVGYGSNRTHFNDTTGLRVRIVAPRPAGQLAFVRAPFMSAATVSAIASSRRTASTSGSSARVNHLCVDGRVARRGGAVPTSSAAVGGCAADAPSGAAAVSADPTATGRCVGC